MPKINKPTLIISSGLTGAGKTTNLKALSKQIDNSIYLDKDTIAKTLLGDEPYFGKYYIKHVQNQSYQLMLQLARDNLALGKVVILDGYFGDKLTTGLLKDYLDSTNFETKVIHFNCSREGLKARVIERADSRDEAKIQDFDSYYTEHYEKHRLQLAIVPHIEVNTENKQDLANNIERILDYVNGLATSPKQSNISPRAAYSLYQAQPILLPRPTAARNQKSSCTIM